MGIAFLKSRSEAPEKVIEWIKAAEAFLGVKLAVLRVDNAPEYVEGRLRDWCKENGVTFEKTVPDASPQNGVAERANRTIAAMTRAMLIGANLPDWFWPLAAQASVHIKNIVPHSANPPDVTPHQTWHREKPNLAHLREFGCKVTARKSNSDTLNKIQPRGEAGIFVGYARDAKGYLIWFPDAHAVRVRRDVIFHDMPEELELPTPRENGTLWDDLILDRESRFQDHEVTPRNVGLSRPEYAYVPKTTKIVTGPDAYANRHPIEPPVGDAQNEQLVGQGRPEYTYVPKAKRHKAHILTSLQTVETGDQVAGTLRETECRVFGRGGVSRSISRTSSHSVPQKRWRP